jgi:hypothetical protein
LAAVLKAHVAKRRTQRGNFCNGNATVIEEAFSKHGVFKAASGVAIVESAEGFFVEDPHKVTEKSGGRV